MSEQRGVRPSRRGFFIYSSIMVLIVMAFSDDLVEGIWGQPRPLIVIPVDVLLLLVAFALIWVGQIATERIDRSAAVTWYAIGAGIILAIDIYAVVLHPSPYQFWASVVHYVAFVLLALVSMAVNPRHLIGTNSAEARERLALGAPLLLGTLGAYAASYAWQWTGSGVDQEYFAQMSQVIPLLFVAVGLEGQYFQRAHGKRSEGGLTAVLLTLLVVGELMALSALVPSSTQGSGLTAWHEYLGLVTTAFACTSALGALILAVLGIVDPAKSLASSATSTQD